MLIRLLVKLHAENYMVFSDASEKVIAAVAYMNIIKEDDAAQIFFVLEKAKVAQFPVEQMDIVFDHVQFYTDSKVALGYIENEKKKILYICS